MKRGSVYVFHFNDELELPLCVADTLQELEHLTGFKLSTLYWAVVHNAIISNKYRVKLVDFRDPEERFDFAEYRKFCKRNNLKEGFPSSLDKFRHECFEV